MRALNRTAIINFVEGDGRVVGRLVGSGEG